MYCPQLEYVLSAVGICKTLNIEVVEYDKNVNWSTMWGREELVAFIPTHMKEPKAVMITILGMSNSCHGCGHSAQAGY